MLKLEGPIYNIDRKHGFDEYDPPVKHDLGLTGPCLNIPERIHQYSEPLDRVVPPRDLQWPCYDIGDVNHHYQGIDEHLESLKHLIGPIYDVPDR